MQSIISEKNNLGSSFFFWKYSNFYVGFGNPEKNSENIFWFGDNCIWIARIRHSLLLRQYFSSGANMLTNSLKIWVTTKTELSELIFFQTDQKIWQKYCREDLNSVPDRLKCWLCIVVLARGFLGISVTRLFAVYNFRKK